MDVNNVTSQPDNSDRQQASAVTPDIIRSVIADLEAIATKATGDFSPETVANIALNKLTQAPTNGSPASGKAAETFPYTEQHPLDPPSFAHILASQWLSVVDRVRDGSVKVIDLSTMKSVTEIVKVSYFGEWPYTVTLEDGDRFGVDKNWIAEVVDGLSQPAPASEPETAGSKAIQWEDTLSYKDLLEYVKDQKRIIKNIYDGKHGVIPHPSEVYQAGLWEIYKVDDYQGHAERVGDVGELSALRRQLATADGGEFMPPPPKFKDETWYDKAYNAGYEAAAKIAREQYALVEMWTDKIAGVQAENSALASQLATAAGERDAAQRMHMNRLTDSLRLQDALKAARNHLQAVADYKENPDVVGADDMDLGEIAAGMWSQAVAGLHAIEALEASQPKAADADEGGGS